MGRLRGRPARLLARLLLALTVGAGAACEAPPSQAPPAAPPPVLAPELEPAFAALRAALEAHDDEGAARILERILARAPDEATRQHADVYARILRGRALAREIELRLEATPEGPDGQVRLTLIGAQPLQQPLALRAGPGTLRQLLTGLDAAGTETRVSRSVAVPQVAQLRLPAGRDLRIDLGLYDVPLAGALAVEAAWDLHLPPGALRLEGTDYPAAALDAAGCETVRLAPWLPVGEVAPDELADYVERGGRGMPALVERAVRVERARRGEALDALAPVALSLTRDERAVLVPVLRWLSGQRELGADVDAWSSWLDRRLAGAADEGRDPLLDLPATGAPPGQGALR